MFRTLTAAAALLALTGTAYAQDTTTETEAQDGTESEMTTETDSTTMQADTTATDAEDAGTTEMDSETMGSDAATDAETDTSIVEIEPAEDGQAETMETGAPGTMAESGPFVTIDLQYGEHYQATTLIGQRVHAIDQEIEQNAVYPAGTIADWDDIGEIGDLIIGVDGTLEAVVVDVGGFLGLGEREVAVQWSSLRGVREDDDPEEYFLGVTMSEGAMEAAPEVERIPAD
jgi:hypothetical protein